MPLAHRIHHALRLVAVRCHGTLTRAEIFGYQNQVWSDPAIAGYDELIEMDEVTAIPQASAGSIRDLADLSALADVPDLPSKLAIVASEDLAYGLGRMYGAHREMNRRSTRQVEVFRSREQALEWLGMREEQLAQDAP